jgi:hypothetical protein
MDIPHELVAAFVEHIDDTQSLKACALAGRSFREPSQRLLFRSLRLGLRDPPNYSSASNLLRDSPHVAKYFTRLIYAFPGSDTTPAEVDDLCAVLHKLSNVCHCQIFGRTVPYFWRDLSPKLALSVAQFLQRQRLSQFHVYWFDALPAAVLTLFLAAAPTITLHCVSIDETSVVASDHPPTALTVQNLLLSGFPTAVIADAIVSPEFLPRMSNLRKLAVDPVWKPGKKLLSAFAHQLEHVRLEHTGTSSPASTIMMCANIFRLHFLFDRYLVA